MNLVPNWLKPWTDASETEENTEETNQEEVELDPENNEEETFDCEYCDFSTDNEAGLNIHAGQVHNSNEEDAAEDSEDVEDAEE